LVLQVLTYKIEPTISQETIEKLTEADYLVILSEIVLEIHNRDLKRISTFLGQEKIIKALKSVISSCYAPLFEIYQAANFGALVKTTQFYLRDLISIAQCGTKERAKKPELLEKYTNLYFHLLTEVYHHLHKVVSHDRGILSHLLEWLLTQMDLFSKSSTALVVNLEELLSKCLGPEKKIQLKEDLSKLKEYENLKIQKRKSRAKKIVSAQLYSSSRIFAKWTTPEEIQEINVICTEPIRPHYEVIPVLVDPFQSLLEQSGFDSPQLLRG